MDGSDPCPYRMGMSDRGTVSLDELEGPQVFSLAQDWNRLATAQRNYFQSEVWSRNWWRHLAGRPPLSSVVIRDRGKVVAIATLVPQSIRLHHRIPIFANALISLGSLWGGGDHQGPLIEDGYPAATEALVDWMTRDRRRTVILPSVSTATATGTKLRARMATVEQESCPQVVIPTGATFGELTKAWSGNRRKKLGQIQRRFERDGGSHKWYEEPAALTRWFPVVERLHRSRMRVLGKKSSFGLDPNYSSFHEALCREATREMGPWIQISELEGRPIAALYGFRIGDAYHVYQSGWDPDAADHSPGLLQYVTALEHVVAEQGTLFDMCRGPDDYKLRFSTRLVEEETLMSPIGVTGLLLRVRWWARNHA